MTTVYWSFSL